jgi:YVTN family beta-propeller protein
MDCDLKQTGRGESGNTTACIQPSEHEACQLNAKHPIQIMARTKFCKLLSLAVFLLSAQLTWAADSLTFFNNWFVTGDYVVAGVGLRGTGVKGWATGNIKMTGVPSNGQPIAAFLYWSTVETSSTPGATVGYFNGNQIQGQALGNPQSPNPPCWANNATPPAKSAGFVYRADVLRFLPTNSNNVFQANGTQIVKLPDSQPTPGTVLYTNGASLVVIYRIVVSGQPLIAPLRAVVIYDGAFTMNKNTAGMSQTVAGFYETSANPQARVTGVVANGQSGFSAPWSVNGTTLSSNPFDGALGARWDNPSYNISLAANSSTGSFTTLETAGNSATCLTWGAIIASVNVQDSDNDGLLDIWETSGLHVNTQVSPATFGTCAQYPSDPCVNLKAMNANPKKQDIFIQMDWMYADGSINGNPAHNHIPPLSSLGQVAATFALHHINVHFDVGNNYQGAQSACGNAPCSFIIPETYAAARPAPDNANGINEATLLCPANTTCAYGNLPYPVLSFEFGFDSVRDGNQSLGISAHLSQERFWAFRYALFAHAIGGPYNANGTPIDPTPLSYSGIAQLPGGGFMVTFGLWGNLVGTPFEVANTIHHELGHTLGLYHGGLSPTPYCMPNYPSAMNYMYQIRGLTDANGNEQVDYSYGLLLPLSENLLKTSIPMALPGLQHYEIRYYGPLAGPLAGPNPQGTSASQAAQVHCDGTPITNGETPIKLQGSAVSTPDWSNGNVALGKLIPPIDLNNEGTLGQVFYDQPDWFVLNLQQIGSSPDFGGISVGAKVSDAGAYTTDAGGKASEAGAKSSDAGAFPDTGVTYSSNAGAVASDAGGKASEAGELNEDTVFFSGGLPSPTNLSDSLGLDKNPSDPNYNTDNSVVLTWINPESVGNSNNPFAGSIFTYNVLRCAGTGCTPGPFTRGAGVAGLTFTDTINDYAHGGTACPAANTCPNTTYVYEVTTVATTTTVTSLCPSGNCSVQSLPSTSVSAEVKVMFVVPIPSNDTITYDGNSSHSLPVQIFEDPSATFASATAQCITGRNVGTYTSLTCSGLSLSAPAAEGVIYVGDPSTNNTPSTYADAKGAHAPGDLTIVQRPITVTAAANSKTYDGTTSAAALPTYAVTIPNNAGLAAGAPPLGTTDAANFSEAYATRFVGTGLTLIPSGSVSDGNNGSNYAYTFTNTQNGVIITRPVTATLTAQNKPYDTTNTEPNSNMSCALSNTVAGDSVACGASNGTFNSNQVTVATTVSATATLSGTAAANYTFGAAGTAMNTTTPQITASANITTLPLTATLTSAPSKVYDGTLAETNPMTCSVATVLSPDVVTCTATNGNFNTSQVTTANLVTATATISGTAASNYTLGPGLTTVSVTSTSVHLASSITTRAVTATLTPQNKLYDGTNTELNGNMSCSLNNIVAGDTNVTCSASNGTFNSSQVVLATTVSATATLGGTTATDYTFGANGTAVNSTTATASAHITPALVTVTAGSLSGTYNGAAQTPSACTVTPTYPLITTFIGAVTCTNNPATETNAGSGTVTPVPSYGADSASNYAITPVNGSWNIAQAPSTTTVMCLPGPFTYTGSPQTPCSASVSGAGGLSLTNLTPTYLNNTNAGVNTASASYTYLGDTNHIGSMGSATFTIGQASATTTISSVSPEPSISSNQQVTVSVTVAPVAPATGAPTGIVTVTSEGGALSCMVMLGTASGCALPAFTTPGTNTVTATYSGDNNFTAGTAATDSNTPGSGNGVAVNPVTNMIYVSNYNDQTVSVIDGTQNTITATIPVPGYPAGIGVNSTTNTVYVALGAQSGAGSLAVINGTTNSVTTTVPVDQAPFAVAVNPTTNMIYVTNNFGAVAGQNNDGTVSVINGSTNALATTFHVGVNPSGVAIDPATNYLYVTIYNFDGSGSGATSVKVLDGTAGTVLGSVTPSAPPWLIDINPTTHRAYVTESGPFGGNNVDVIDITTASSPTLVAAVPVGADPYGVAVDATDNLVYVSNYGGNTVSVIDGLSNTVRQTIPVGSNPQGVAFNPAAASAYIANGGSNTMSVIVVPTLASIAVTPSSPSITGTGTQQFTATGTYSDTTTRNLTNLVTWASTATNVATITTGPGAGAGLATGVSAGPTTISAALNVTGSTQLTVNPVAPSITSPTTGFITTSPVPVSGTALTGATVTIYDGATQVATAITAAAFGAGVSVPLSVGVGHSLTATQTVNGATSAASSPAITGTVNPVAPSITSPTTGFSTTSPVQVSGTALTGATVTIYDGATLVFTTTGDAFGTGVSVPLSVGPGHSLTAIQTLNGATSAASSPAITGTVNPPPATFSATGPMNIARSNPTVTLLQNGQVLVAGGFDGSNPLASAELYDPNTGLFTVTAGPMSAPRYVHTATLLPNGQVLITGGQSTAATLASAELYNPATGTFSLTGPMTTPRQNQTATLLQNGQVLVAGGNDSSSPLASAELYDPTTGSFTATNGPMGTARYVPNAALLPNGQVLIAGGITNPNPTYVASAELYDPTTGTFSYTTGQMSTARGYFTATLLQNGQVLAAGGYNGSAQVLTAELYDPRSGTFTLTGSQINQQGGPATLLGDGQVLFAGGYNGSSLTTAELYNPATGMFSLTGPMTTARNGPAATLLVDGQVLVVGGANSSGVLNSAELYAPPN